MSKIKYEVGGKIKMNTKIDKRKLHILAIVEDHIMFKWYSYTKKYWKYGVESIYYFNLFLKDGLLKYTKN